jgi:hypothetical protein
VFSAGWTDEERYHAKTFHTNIQDPYILTLKTYSEKPSMSFPFKKKSKIRKAFISSHYFKKGHIPYLLGEAKNDNKIRPLIVYIPGTFSKLFSQITKDFHLRFIRLGYRVISFENLLHHEALDRGPLFNLLDAKAQAKAYFEAAKAIHKHLHQEGKVNHDVALIGQSYGGFLASVMFDLDATNSKKLKDNFFKEGLHVYSPPFDFSRSVERFDEILKEAKKDKFFGRHISYIATHFKVSQVDKESEISPRLRSRSLSLFIDFGFRFYLQKTLESIQRLKGTTFIPRKKGNKKKFFENLTFRQAFYLMGPADFLNFTKSEERTLSFWIKSAIKKGRNNIRILSSQDDMINDGIDPILRGSSYMMMIPTGGHFGYRQSLWFDQLLVKVFEKKDPERAWQQRHQK